LEDPCSRLLRLALNGGRKSWNSVVGQPKKKPSLFGKGTSAAQFYVQKAEKKEEGVGA